MNNIVSSSEPVRLKSLGYALNSGNPVSLTSDSEGNLYVKNLNSNAETQNLPLTAFKELRVATLTPVAGWNFNYNINTDVVTPSTVNLGSVSQSNAKAVLQTGADDHSSASIQTINVLRYTPGVGGLVRFTSLFSSGVAGSTQIIGIGDANDGFFFGYNGEDFGVLRRQNGSNNWIPKNTWNKDRVDGTGLSGMDLNPTLGNVYSIRFQWLGFGAIEFMIENPTTGEAILVHRIEYANKHTNPSIYNPTLPVFAMVENTTNETNITLQTPSAMAFIEGIPYAALNIRHCISHSTLLTDSATPIDIPLLTITNKTLFQTLTNRVQIKLDFLSATNESSKFVSFKLVKNATITDASTPEDISTSTSVVSYTTGGTYGASSGTLLLSFQCVKQGALQILLNSLNLFLSPGDRLTVLISSSSATPGDISASLTWLELF